MDEIYKQGRSGKLLQRTLNLIKKNLRIELRDIKDKHLINYYINKVKLR